MSTFQTFNDANLKEIGVLAYGARHKMLLAIAGEFKINATVAYHQDNFQVKIDTEKI